MKKQFLLFVVRWLTNALALWISAQLLHLVDTQENVMGFIIGGLILSILNAIVKPVLVILTLPAIALSLGFFLIVINGIVVYLASLLYQPLHIESFWAAVLVGIVIGLVNYIVTITAEAVGKRYVQYF